MLDFYKCHTNNSIIKDINQEHGNLAISEWNKTVPKYIKLYNNLSDDRSAVIHFALFVEHHIDSAIINWLPGFNSHLGLSKTMISQKINILAASRLIPEQVLMSCRCINSIRNQFAHDIKTISFSHFDDLLEKDKKNTIFKLIELTDTYESEYSSYLKIDKSYQTRFKTLSMSVIAAFSYYLPSIIELRIKIESY
jgi:hypothetical protein